MGLGFGAGEGVGWEVGLGVTSGCWVVVADWLGDGEGRTLTGAAPHAVTMNPANNRAAPRVQAIS